MMAAIIEIKNLENVNALLTLRNRELGQTTKQSATALVVNILTSLKADTRIANPKKLNFDISDVTAMYKASWDGKKGFCWRNAQGSKTVPPKSWIVISREGFPARSYVVTDKDVRKRYLVAADDAKQAKDVVKKLHVERVEKRKGLAKAALGVAQARLAEKSGMGEITNPNVRKSSLENVTVETRESGFDSGDVEIRVKDGLNYAADALRSGHGYVQVAAQKAMNKMAGQLLHFLKQRGRLTDDLRIKLEDVIDRSAR